MTAKEYFNPGRMTQWDGTHPNGKSRYRYPVERSPFAPYYIDSDGSIFYTMSNGKLSIWCGASRINRHFQRLLQLGVLVEV